MSSSFPCTVTIYGTGLMGSSFALALKQAIPGIRVFGVDSDDILDRALVVGAIDEKSQGSPNTSDLVILCAPVGEIVRRLNEMNPGPHIILDVGSTKLGICKAAEARKLSFVGGHPMAGSERSGPEAASADLFRNTGFFLCPIDSTPPDAISKLEGVIRAIGATPHVISPENHDKVVAEMSHLPQLLSTLLAEHTGAHREFAGPGWKSVTRLAASPFHVWRDILATSDSLPDELRAYIQRLHDILDALERKDLTTLEAVFQRANRAVRE